MGLLSISIWLPIAFGALLLTLGSDQRAGVVRALALVGAVTSFLVTVPLVTGFSNSTSGMQFVEKMPWIDRFNVNYHLGLDGLSLWFVPLTAFITIIVVIAAWEVITERVGQYMGAFLILSGLLVGVFCALDGLLFYVFFEATLIPMYLIIGVWGGPRRVYAAFKFFLYTLLGSLLMLVALVYLYFKSGGSFDILAWHRLPLPLSTQALLFFAFFAAFAVKVPMWPVHTWLPDAQSEGPPLAAVALGIKVGTYGLLVIAYPLFPTAALHPTTRLVLATLGVIAVLYGSLVALAQPDFRRVISYASIAHLGFVVLGISAFTPESLNGAMLVMLNAGITTGGMFLALGFLKKRVGDDRFHALGGLARQMPMLGAVVVLFALANAGLPGTNGFVGEFLVLIGSFSRFPMLVLCATISVILAAAYLLWSVQRMLFGPSAETVGNVTDLTRSEAAVMGCFVVAIIGLGLAPSPVLNRMNESVTSLANRVTLSSLLTPTAAVDAEVQP